MAFNNTYGIQAINESVYHDEIDAYAKPGGCKDQILECRKPREDSDPDGLGNNEKANLPCFKAMGYCHATMVEPYLKCSNHGWRDIAHPHADLFPAPYLLGYLQQNWVQAALGVPVNYTFISSKVNEVFTNTIDFLRPGILKSIAYLLDSGVRVALVYGDRDYACSWIGGEWTSLAVNYSKSETFRLAGYTPILSTVGIGGQVRLQGNFSFSRVLSSTWHIKNEIPEVPQPTCYILAPDTCTEEQYAAVRNGSAVVKDYIVVENWTMEGVWVGGYAPAEDQHPFAQDL